MLTRLPPKSSLKHLLEVHLSMQKLYKNIKSMPIMLLRIYLESHLSKNMSFILLPR